MKTNLIDYTVEDIAKKIGKKAARGFFVEHLINPDNGSVITMDEYGYEHTLDSESWRKYNHSYGYERTVEYWDGGLHPSRWGGALCCRCFIEKGIKVTHAPGRKNDPYSYVEIEEDLRP